MKGFLLTFVICSTIWSCSSSTVDNSNSDGTSTTKDNLIAQPDTNHVEINANFPFGCADLTKLKYPKHWEGDLENYGQLKQPNGKEFDDIGKCFALINLAKTIKSPKLQGLQVLKIGNNYKSAFDLDTLAQKSFNSCKYRLPNIGTYECYYSYDRFGNLLLLDPKTKNGKLLNIYFDDIGGDSHTFLRYFLIKNNAIHIYEGSCYDDGCTLDEKYKIIIDQDGGIKINEVQR